MTNILKLIREEENVACEWKTSFLSGWDSRSNGSPAGTSEKMLYIESGFCEARHCNTLFSIAKFLQFANKGKKSSWNWDMTHFRTNKSVKKPQKQRLWAWGLKSGLSMLEIACFQETSLALYG